MVPKLIPILAIGAAGYQGMTPEFMEGKRQEMIGRAEKEGFLFDAIFIDTSYGEDVRKKLEQKLQLQKWEIVLLSGGVRLGPENTRLLENVANLVLSTVKPAPKLGFPTLPEEMIPTFHRLAAMIKEQ